MTPRERSDNDQRWDELHRNPVWATFAAFGVGILVTNILDWPEEGWTRLLAATLLAIVIFGIDRTRHHRKRNRNMTFEPSPGQSGETEGRR